MVRFDSTKLNVDAKSFAHIDDKFFARKKDAAAGKKDSFFAGDKEKKVTSSCIIRCVWVSTFLSEGHVDCVVLGMCRSSSTRRRRPLRPLLTRLLSRLSR